MSSVEIQRQSVWVSVLCVLSKQTVGGRTRSEAASCRRISSIVLEAVKCVKRNGYNLSLLKQIVITFFRYHYFCYTRLFSIFKALKDVLKSQETGGGYKQYSPSGKEYFLKRSIPFSGFRFTGIWKGRDFNSCHFRSLKWSNRANRCILRLRKKSRKRSGFVIYSYFKDRALTVVKGDAKFLTKYVKGVPFVSRKYVKGVPFLIEGIWKGYLFGRMGLDLEAGPPRITLCWVKVYSPLSIGLASVSFCPRSEFVPMLWSHTVLYLFQTVLSIRCGLL